MIRWTLRHCRGIIAVSSKLKTRMMELGAPAGKIDVIGNGVDTERFHVMERERARRQLQLPQDGPILVCVASLREAKGQQHVISALGKIAAKHAGVKLYLVGDGANRKHLEELRQQLGLQDRVIFVGNRDNNEIPLWFNAADVSILASSREGWPNVVLESLACGTPVVASPVGEIPEILTSPELGIIVTPDPDSLAVAIDTALQRGWDREAISRYACQRPWRRVAEELQAYFKRVTP